MTDPSPEVKAAMQALANALVDTTAIIRRVYRDGTPEELSRLVTLKPRSLNGWRNRAAQALEEASKYISIPTEPEATIADCQGEMPPIMEVRKQW